MSNIDLGFAQQISVENKWKLKNKYFPSKIGGKPVFLDLQYIPSYNDLKCGKCGQTLRFLLQIYAPIETREEAFHRTLFVFCCYNNDCNRFQVLRSQLCRINSYYSSDPPNYDEDEESYDPKPQLFGHQLCIVCGFEAKNKCSKCLKVNYCSKECQIIDWKEGNHKLNCGLTESPTLQKSDTQHFSNIFPEFELIIDGNESDNNDSDNDCNDCNDNNDNNDNNVNNDNNDNDSDLEKNEMKKYNDLIGKSCPKYQTQNLEEYEESYTEEQRVFNRFKRLSSGEEVIRYCSYDEDSHEEQEPLWISTKNKPTLPIPKCQYCGSDRRFEFQIMPQLLNKILKAEDKLDWGLLIVYTCANSCSHNSQVVYKEEFIWKQTIE